MRKFSESITVDKALYQRVLNIFKTGSNVYLSFSGGKESLVCAQCIKELVDQKRINPKQLLVMFIDEEGIYPDVERIVLAWRERFLRMGAEFMWLCLPFFHYNCFNELTNDESFILFEPGKEDVWIRQPPSFAIRNHPDFRPGDTYQSFTKRIADGYLMIGMRADESVQRQYAIGAKKNKDNTYFYPIYDWNLHDVWKFLLEHDVEIPESYLFMWKTGVPLNKLRISQFFSIDVARTLVKMVEFYPGLYEKILRREPNAYMALYYWDSEMFRRMSETRKKIDADAPRDYKAEVMQLLKEKNSMEAKEARRFLIQFAAQLEMFTPQKRNSVYRVINDMVVAGDPKMRTRRRLYSSIFSDIKKATDAERRA